MLHKSETNVGTDEPFKFSPNTGPYFITTFIIHCFILSLTIRYIMHFIMIKHPVFMTIGFSVSLNAYFIYDERLFG